MSNRENVAERVRALANVMRARNGRLAIDWLSRRQKPRWKMVQVGGQYYDRNRLRKLVDRSAGPWWVPGAAPGARRRLTDAEVDTVRDPNPWRLLR